MNDVTATGTDLKEVLRAGRQRAANLTGTPAWLEQVRERGAAEFAGLPLPDRRQEAWRYTSIGFLDQATYRPMREQSFDALQPADIEDLLLQDSDALRLVFVNGHLAASLSTVPGTNDGILVGSLQGMADNLPQVLRDQLDAITAHRTVFTALNSALMSDGALIHVPRAHDAGRPIEILHIGVGMDEPAIVHPRHLIVVDPGARVEVIERYCGLGDGVYFNNALIEVALGEDSQLVHGRLQEESRNAQHLSDLQVRLAAGSRYRLVQASLGGAWSRTEVHVDFTGEGAEAELDGLMLARDRQLTDVHLSVQHKVPHCTSRETFKGILDGSGRVVFDGHIVVARDAQKSDAVLANDNLMLSRAAEVDTKPQLEIYADDVKCSHGTTVGELDSDMLFYLRSRGIGEAKARQMLCHGFAQEVLDRIDHAPLRARAATLLSQRLLETLQDDEV
ncbi:MAG: Fe-S cluster assembly protein SufD [Chromatiaceae bacterium]|nr:Fe-S cluster assembly protein SufD [Chromatiaceae bacterium]